MNEPVENLTAWGAKGAASAWRWLLAALGVVCFGLGAVGAIVPGLPTTVFLLLGSFFLTKSCPWLERRLLQSRLFRPYAAFLDPATPFSPRGRATALAAMWISIVITLALLAKSPAGAAWLLFLIAAAGVIGTVVILRFRRHLERPRANPDAASR